MQKTKKRARNKKLIILSSILLVIIAGLFSANRVLEKIVQAELNNQLNLNDSSLYRVNYESMKINIFSGSLKITNLIVEPCEMAMSRLKAGDIRKLVRTEIPLYRFSNLNLFSLINDKKILVNTIASDQIFLDYFFNPNAKQPKKKNTLTLQVIFSESFNEAKINKLSLKNTRIRFFDISTGDSTVVFEIDSLSILADMVTINRETLKNSIPFDLEDIQVSTGQFQLKTLEDYTISTSNIHFDVADTTLYIEGFSLKPKFSRKGFSRKIKYNTDLFDIKIPEIIFRGIDLHEMEFNAMIDVSSIKINEANIEIYRDKRLPDAPFKYKPLLGRMIKNIPVNFMVDSLILSDCKLTYSEQIFEEGQPGTVWFDPMKIVTTNITNHPDRISANPILNIDFTGQIMSKARLNANLAIRLDTPSENFTVSGSLAPTPAAIFNPMIEFMAPVKITDGQLLKTAFDFHANDNTSEGLIQMDYENLSVNVTRLKNHKRKWAILSMVANGLIRPNNMKENKKHLTGRIHFDRHKDKAIVNFLWNSIKTGAIAIAAPFADQNKKTGKEKREEKKKEKKGNKK